MGDTRRIVWILLAALGVPVWLVVGVLAGALWQKIDDPVYRRLTLDDGRTVEVATSTADVRYLDSMRPPSDE